MLVALSNLLFNMSHLIFAVQCTMQYAYLDSFVTDFYTSVVFLIKELKKGQA